MVFLDRGMSCGSPVAMRYVRVKPVKGAPPLSGTFQCRRILLLVALVTYNTGAAGNTVKEASVFHI